jgi:hypothetical protein
MNLRAVLQWVMASSLGWLLLSCGATRNVMSGHAAPAELPRYLLVIEEKPAGQVFHTWRPLSDGDAARYLPHANKGRFEGSITQVAFNRDCEAERDDCEEMCRASLKGRTWSHASEGSKDAICRKKCMPAYLDCCRLREASETGTKRISFPTVDGAVDWLKRHRREILVGTVVVIAGVAFVAVVAGSGGAALVLAPAVLLASSHLPATPVQP